MYYLWGTIKIRIKNRTRFVGKKRINAHIQDAQKVGKGVKLLTIGC